MQAIEYTIQRLIGSGMDPKTENNPYLGFIYTSFQERATKVRRSTATSACYQCMHASMHAVAYLFSSLSDCCTRAAYNLCIEV